MLLISATGLLRHSQAHSTGMDPVWNRNDRSEILLVTNAKRSREYTCERGAVASWFVGRESEKTLVNSVCD